MKKLYLGWLLIMAFGLVACAPHQPQTPYPYLERAIYLNMDMAQAQKEYDELYMFSDEKTKEFMDKNILPKMFEIRDAINIYTDLALLDQDDPELYQNIKLQLRALSAELAGVQR